MSVRGKVDQLSFSKNNSLRTKLAGNLIEFNKERMNKSYAFPATIFNAQIHEIANTFGYNSLVNDDGSPSSVCPCCKFPINTQQLPLDYPTTLDVRLEHIEGDETYKISSGISLFFTFIKMNVCYLLLRFILTDAFNLISSAAAGTFCKNNNCNSIIISQMSSYNKIEQENLVYALDILNLITIILSIGFFNFYRKIQYKIYSLINASQHTQDDYSLYFKGIPILLIDQNADPNNITFDYSQKLKKYLEEKLNDWMLKTKDLEVDKLEPIEKQFRKILKNKNISDIKKVTSITMCFDLEQMEVLRDMRKDLMDKYVKIVAEREKQNLNTNQLIEQDQDSNNFENVLHQIKLLNNQQILLSQKFAEDSSMAFNLTHFVGKAFISFEYQHFRDYILRETDRNANFLAIRKDYPMKVELASTPGDVIWQNMSVSTATRMKNIAKSYLVLIMILTFAFAGILMVERWNYETNASNQASQSLFLTILMTVITLVINFILSVIVKWLTQFERHSTKSNFLFSHIVKAVITQFINTSIIYYVSSKVTHSHYLEKNGLVIQVTSLFLTSGIIQIVLNLVNPMDLVLKAKKFLKYRHKTQVNKFQNELNLQIERVEFDVVDRYSYYILQIYTCSFYTYLAPIATPCLIITFCIQYWIDKYNLFKRSTCKNQMDFFLSRTILKIFQTSLFILALGNFIFSVVLHKNNVNSVNVASLVITGVYALFIMFAPRHLQKKIFGSYQQIETKAYSECLKQKLFKEQYWTTNPATKFVREIDINTKLQIAQQDIVKFANEAEFKEAKLQLDVLVKNEDLKINSSSFKSPKANPMQNNQENLGKQNKE